MRLIDADALKDMMLQAYNDALPEFDMPWKKKMAHIVTLSFMAGIPNIGTEIRTVVSFGQRMGSACLKTVTAPTVSAKEGTSDG